MQFLWSLGEQQDINVCKYRTQEEKKGDVIDESDEKCMCTKTKTGAGKIRLPLADQTARLPLPEVMGLLLAGSCLSGAGPGLVAFSLLDGFFGDESGPAALSLRGCLS
jgi:hypothetical protein